MLVGKVIHGDGLGKGMGWPTANLGVNSQQNQLAEGVYAAKVELQGEDYQAALIVTSIPYKAEVYLFDYSGPDFYNKELNVEPLQKVGEVFKLESTEELVKKIESDIQKIRNFFKENKV